MNPPADPHGNRILRFAFIKDKPYFTAVRSGPFAFHVALCYVFNFGQQRQLLLRR